MKTLLTMLAGCVLLGALTATAGCNKGSQAENAGITVSQAPAKAAGDLNLTPATDGQEAAGAEICADCGKPESECTCEGHAAEGARSDGSDPNCAGCADEKAKTAPAATPASEEKTRDGIRLVDASVLDTNPAAYAGRIAIHGKVGAVMADKGVFTLVDLKKLPGCKDGCCPKTDIPIRVPSDQFTGNLPKPDDEVIVVGELSTTEANGYQIDVQIVRIGEQAIMIKSSKGAKTA
jgi:hypothetical protein